MKDEAISLVLHEPGKGRMEAVENGTLMGFLEVSLDNERLIAHHTEVLPAGEGKGWGRRLFNAVVEYARENNLKIKPYCTFIHAQLKKHADEVQDVWKQD